MQFPAHDPTRGEIAQRVTRDAGRETAAQRSTDARVAGDHMAAIVGLVLGAAALLLAAALPLLTRPWRRRIAS